MPMINRSFGINSIVDERQKGIQGEVAEPLFKDIPKLLTIHISTHLYSNPGIRL